MILPMDTPYFTFCQTLKQKNLSLTTPRKLIFQVLNTNEPLTIAEIIKACHGEIDRVTVYRTIELFEKLQIVQKLNIGWKYKIELSHPYQLHHHHMTCTRCHKIFALPEDEVLEARIKILAKSGSFTAIDHQIEIRGICQVCSV
jgi:Fur family ferric uptake transcriptional regulator